mmetsp:Transcript_16665/g.34191  ORF Transcript_16665/g.34191 Transcript_16665/m.34191 type:complete len:183 (-) Transcript_16665:159-707(-)
MATPKSLTALEKSKEAVLVIKERLAPVLQRLTDDTFGEQTGRAQASVALSIGMMRYMGARLRGLDKGRKSDDPLRKDLNNIKRVLAKTMKSTKAIKTTKKTFEAEKAAKLTAEPTADTIASKLSKSPRKSVNSAKRKKLQPKIEKETAASQQGGGSNKKKRKTNSIASVKSPDSASKKTRKK